MSLVSVLQDSPTMSDDEVPDHQQDVIPEEPELGDEGLTSNAMREVWAKNNLE